jgi:hypothetical protein
MASEDSDQLVSGRLPIHGRNDLRDLNQTLDIEMPTVCDQPHAARELLKVALLRRAKRMGLEERNYRSKKLLSPVHDELAQVLAMVVLTLVHVHPTDAKEALELLQRRSAAETLRHDKPMRDLVPGSVALPSRPAWLPDETDGEAPLSVYKAGNPAELNQPFLLVVCTHGIVTVSPAWDGTRSLGFSGFPAYSQMHTTRLPVRGAAILP